MREDWIGLVPAAGKGLRLNLPYPKELYPVIRNNHYKPVAQFVIDQMVGVGIKHIVFVINETKHQLIGYFGSGSRFGCSFSYVVQEDIENNQSSTSPGLGIALDAAYHLTTGKTVFFGMPDTIIQPKNMYRQCMPYLAEYDLELCLFPTEFPNKFGMVRRNEEGKVLEIIDKPQKTELKYMWGSIVWKARFTEYLHHKITSEKVYDFASIINQAIRDGLSVHSTIIEDGDYIDLGTYTEILELDKRLRDNE
ncbi:TPA: hypothetical protein ENX78_12835 [Candidatus Poribacteria bacterium]|jgi:glucose-1-phosphate thymidylyltransferase|nr:hypothetical protein [Candidatus Poribacteria bacterium]